MEKTRTSQKGKSKRLKKEHYNEYILSGNMSNK